MKGRREADHATQAVAMALLVIAIVGATAGRRRCERWRRRSRSSRRRRRRGRRGGDEVALGVRPQLAEPAQSSRSAGLCRRGRHGIDLKPFFFPFYFFLFYSVRVRLCCTPSGGVSAVFLVCLSSVARSAGCPSSPTRLLERHRQRQRGDMQRVTRHRMRGIAPSRPRLCTARRTMGECEKREMAGRDDFYREKARVEKRRGSRGKILSSFFLVLLPLISIQLAKQRKVTTKPT